MRGVWVAIGLAAAIGCRGDGTSEPVPEPDVSVAANTDAVGADDDATAVAPSTTTRTSSSSTVPTVTTTVVDPPGGAGATTLSGPVMLRGDGLGDARFGDPMSSVEPWLRDQLGLPRSTAAADAPLAASQPWEADEGVRVLAFSLGARGQESVGYWNEGRLEVVFSDVSPGPDDGTLRFAGWQTVRWGMPRLAAGSGLTVGWSEAKLLRRFPDMQLGAESFEIVSAPTGEAGIRGRLGDAAVTHLAAGAEERPADELPDPPPPPEGAVIEDLPLRPDGIGTVDLKSPAEGLRADLEARFGPPTATTTVLGAPGSLRSWSGYFPDSAAQILTWFDPGLTIVTADGPVYGGSIPGQLRLADWATTSSRLQLDTGLGVGSTIDEMSRTYGDVTLGVADECAGAFFPDDFVVSTDRGDIHGSIDWNWVVEVQDALNARGAELEIDGVYGPVTQDAVADFQEASGIVAREPWDSEGEIGPDTLAALDVPLPSDAPVVRLAALDVCVEKSAP